MKESRTRCQVYLNGKVQCVHLEGHPLDGLDHQYDPVEIKAAIPKWSEEQCQKASCASVAETAMPCVSELGAFWQKWFEEVGAHATVDVVHATTKLVLAERAIHARDHAPDTAEVARRAARRISDFIITDRQKKCIHCDPSYVQDDWCNCRCHNNGEF